MDSRSSALYLGLSVALAGSLLATPLVRWVARRRGWADLPDGHLHPHGRPIPRVGGAAIFVGFLLGMLAGAIGGGVEGRVLAVGLGSGGLVFGLGLVDDLRGLNSRLRLGGHLLAALAVVLGGFRVGFLPWPLLGIPLAILLVAGSINALNLLDGLDGLAAGVTAIAGVGFILLFIAQGGKGVGLPLAAALLGSVLGFLPYNARPASIFMGDGGSTLLGLVLAILALEASSLTPSLKGFLAALALLGVPAFDTTLAIVRRLLSRRPLFVGDRSHFYDRLVDRGHTPRATVAICCLLGLGFVGLAQLLLRLSNWGALVVSLLVVLGLLGGTAKLNLLGADR